MILKTKRLFLRKMDETDFDDLCEMLCDEEVMYAYAHAFTHEEAKHWLVHQLQRYEEDGVGLWVMIRLEDQVMVGQCGITKQKLGDEEVWEIGYLLKKKYWHQGYAREAARACKRYAFQKMELPCVYSIIRDDNEASKRVALANDMVWMGQIVKHYFGMDMPHDVYCAQNRKAKELPTYYLYMDAEFDAVKINHKFHQQVISIGACLVDLQGTLLDTFYQTIHPKNFKRITSVVKRMTKLDNETILSSQSLEAVMHAFGQWMYQYESKRSKIAMFSFGPDDKRTILQHCKMENIPTQEIFCEVGDLQRVISSKVFFQEKLISPTLSLDDLKLVYQIHGDVEHNALNDALDLMAIHQALLQGKQQDEESIQQIVNRKTQKQLEARKKQQKHFQRIMKERFIDISAKKKIPLYYEILDQFRSWEIKDENFKFHFKKKYMEFETIQYDYDKLNIELAVETKEEFPSVTLFLKYENKEIIKKYILDYHNATPIENIMKRVGIQHEQ